MNYKTILAATAAGFLLVVAGQASAAFINGDVGIGGSALISEAAKTVDVVGDTGNVLNPGGTGDLSVMATNDPVSFSDFSYGAAFVPLTIWTSATGFAFDLATLSDDLNPSPSFVAVQGTGLLTNPGFDDTPASFTFSANIAGGDVEWRFSADTATNPPSVPEPLTLGLLGVGLVGLGMAARRRHTS